MGGAPGHKPTERDLEERIEGRLSLVTGEAPRKYTVRKLKLMDHYEAALNDPDLLNLSRAVALIDARVQELMDQTNYRDSSAIWTELETTATAFQSLFDQFRSSILAFDRNRNNSEEALKHLNELFATIQSTNDDKKSPLKRLSSLVSQGSEQWAVWSDIFRSVEQLRKVTESQRGREKELKTLVPQAEVRDTFLAMYDDIQDAANTVLPSNVLSPEIKAQLLNAIANKWVRRSSNLERTATTQDGDHIIR